MNGDHAEQPRQGPAPTLRWTARPRRSRTQRVVLLFHGRAGTDRRPPRAINGVVLLLRPFAWAIRRRGRGRVAVARVIYPERGWHGEDRVRDGRTALTAVRRRYPDLPIALLGHSMGGRVVLRLAAEPDIDRVATFGLWAEQEDVPRWQVGQQPRLRMWLVHGDQDRVTDPEGSRVAAARFAELGADVDLHIAEGEGHALLTDPRRWHRQFATWLTESSG